MDVNYYLLSQVFPVILRICEPIEGIDDVFLANNLGNLELMHHCGNKMAHNLSVNLFTRLTICLQTQGFSLRGDPESTARSQRRQIQQLSPFDV